MTVMKKFDDAHEKKQREAQTTQSEKTHIRTAEEINLQSTTLEPPLP